METFRLSVKDKGRVVLPVALQRACGFAPGDELVVHSVGPGRFIVESTTAVLERIWSHAPEGSPVPAVTSLEAWRSETEVERRADLGSPADSSEAESEQRAARLLAEFGL